MQTKETVKMCVIICIRDFIKVQVFFFSSKKIHEDRCLPSDEFN